MVKFLKNYKKKPVVYPTHFQSRNWSALKSCKPAHLWNWNHV